LDNNSTVQQLDNVQQNSMTEQELIKTYTYKYVGTYPAELYNPVSVWKPGDVKEVTEPINHYLFVLVDGKKTKDT
jgi:hypothetical protein